MRHKILHSERVLMLRGSLSSLSTIFRPALSVCLRGSINCTLCLLDAGLLSRVGLVGILTKSTSSPSKGHLKGLGCCGCLYLLIWRPTLQGAKVLGHDQPFLDASGGKFRHSLPVWHEDECFVEHLLWRLFALSVLYSSHDGNENAHFLAVSLSLCVVVDVLGRAHCERRVEDMSVEGFDIVLYVLALNFEELRVIGGCWEDGAIDGDVGRDGIS